MNLQLMGGLAALLMLSAAAQATEWPVCSGGDRAARHVTCVVDGDTWWINGVKYRMACVDAVEIGSPRGPEARDELRNILGRADARVRDLGVKGKYRRSLAIIDVGSAATAGGMLVGRGLAEKVNYADTRKWCR